MLQSIYESEHQMLRESFQSFLTREVVPFYEQWERDGMVPRAVWTTAGRQGFLGMSVPEAYGGAGIEDFRFEAVIVEELARGGFPGLGFGTQNDIVIPYLLALATDEQKARWLPGIVRGEIITAVAMTEPSAGSDLGGITTVARRDADRYILSGQKTMISNGILADLVVVAAMTDPSRGQRGMSLFVIERDMPGFRRGKPMEKIGQHAQDTGELFFDDVPVPTTNLLGREGHGFIYLNRHLAQERLTIAVGAVASAEAALDWTIDYCKGRTAFGQRIADFQHTRFTLAELKTEVTLGRTFIDQCILAHNRGELTADEAAMAKWWTTELTKRVTDAGVQLHGGYGYMRAYPIARAYLDARVQTIYGGTTEIMKEIIGHSLLKER